MAHRLDQEGLAETGLDVRAVNDPVVPQHRKGVARQPGHEDLARQPAAEAPGGLAQQGVAVIVAEHVVGRSKLIHIDNRQRPRPAVGAQAGIERANQRGAVGQAHLAVDEGIAAQLGHQVDVFGTEGDVGAEDFEQLAIHLADRPGRIDEGRKALVVALAEIQSHAARVHQAVAIPQGPGKLGRHPRIVELRQAPLDQVAEMPRRGDDPVFQRPVTRAVFGRGAHQPLGLDAQQAGELGDHALGEGLQALIGNELVARRDDLLETAPVGVQPEQLVVGADRRGQGGEQLLLGQLALGLVIVDVVAGDRLALRRVAGLAGAQDDACIDELELVADHIDEAQAGVLALHHHIQQDHRDVALGAERLQRLTPGHCMQQRKRAAENPDTGKGEAAGLVDIAIVIDDEDSPRRRKIGRRLGRVILFVQKDERIIRHTHWLILIHSVSPGLADFLPTRTPGCRPSHPHPGPSQAKSRPIWNAALPGYRIFGLKL